jgi:hypothetical protein
MREALADTMDAFRGLFVKEMNKLTKKNRKMKE